MNLDSFDNYEDYESQINDLDALLKEESRSTFSLASYTETGVYVEEYAEDNDLLIVIGTEHLNYAVRQFYISHDNFIYTRVFYENSWSPWFQIQIENIEEEEFNFNQYLSSTVLISTGVQKFNAAPTNFPNNTTSLDNLIICMQANSLSHYIQFLISDDKKSFWIRHLHENEEWSEWMSFI